MIIPSIDILGGKAVQLVGGKPGPDALDLGEPRALADRLAVAGELAVVDLDAALGHGDNEALITDILRAHPCRVGGGIRSVDKALRMLDLGATKVILGTAACSAVLSQLPRDRVIAALDEAQGKVVVHGWQTQTSDTVEQRLEELKDLVSGFLVTSVDREGRQAGMDEGMLELLGRYHGWDLTLAGGITTADEIHRADVRGVNVQVGMALHTGRLDLGEAIAAPLVPSDRADGLWPTVVCDERGVALGLAWSNLQSVKKAVAMQRGVYHSRKRGTWIKGATSGDVQQLMRVDLDCDRDALRFTVCQQGRGFCHHGTWTCFGPAHGLTALEQTILDRIAHAPAGSYTRRLLEDDPLLAAKLVEEAGELAEARGPHAVLEAADLLYFALVKTLGQGFTLADVERELDHRSRKVSRRPGDMKPHQGHP